MILLSITMYDTPITHPSQFEIRIETDTDLLYPAGYGDKGDFECVLMLVCGPDITDAEVCEVMEKTFLIVDTDEDGRIDYDEFSKIVSRTDVHAKVSISNFNVSSDGVFTALGAD